METINHGKNYMIDHHGSYGTANAYMYLWFGDPEMDIYLGIPSEPTVIHPGVVLIGPNSFAVNVQAEGSPYEGAAVCVYKEDEVYQYDYTNATGDVVFDINPTTPGFLTLTVTGQDLQVYQIDLEVIPPEGPYIVYNSFLVDDDLEGTSYGNGDGVINPGETIELPLEVINIGIDTAYGVSGVITTDDEYITIVDDTEFFGDIAPGDSLFTEDDFDFTVGVQCPDGHSARFTLETSDSSDSTWTSTFSMIVRAPILAYDSMEIDDAPPGGDGDGVLEPGELADLDITVFNSGSAQAHNVHGTISSTDQYIIILSDESNYGTIDPGEAATSNPSYRIYIDPGIPHGHKIPIDIELMTFEGYTFEDVFELVVISSGFWDDMESGEGDWDHYAVTSGYTDQWHLESHRSYSSTHSWKCGGSGSTNYDNLVDAALSTSTVGLPRNASLTFWHWMDAQIVNAKYARDGGILEISTDEGRTWAQITPDGGYPYQIIDNPASPFEADTPCFSGSHDWKQETFDLSAYKGIVDIRFRFGSDAATGKEGWYIDDVVIKGDLSVEVDLIPDDTSVPRGETTGFVVRITNLAETSQTFQVWTELTMPNGYPYPGNPHIGPQQISLPAGRTVQTHIDVTVPMEAPLGRYIYAGLAGAYPDDIIAGDSFVIEVTE
jgi:hypothetical protein